MSDSIAPQLRIALVQAPIIWMNIQANLAQFEQIIRNNCQGLDLILLPEMFTTGFDLRAAQLAEIMHGNTTRWLKMLASQTKAVICGTFPIKENGAIYNRMLWVCPDGTVKQYDKRHLFSLANEQQHFSEGQKREVWKLKGWKLCPQICYDLRFPVWSRQNEQRYDILFYLANWPQARTHAWETLAQARAIENCAYCLAVNRVGTDGHENYYNGASAVINFDGKVLQKVQDKQSVIIETLDYQKLINYRTKFTALDDADKFQLLA